MKKIKRRMVAVGVLAVLLLGLYIARLAQVQLFQTESFSTHNINLIENSIKQRTQQVLIEDGRGRFLDRNENPIGEQFIPAIVLFPFLKNYDWPIEEVQSILTLSKTEISSRIEKAEEPVLITNEDGIYVSDDMIRAINDLQIPGAFGVYMEVPIQEQIANHVIGLTSIDKRLVGEKYEERESIPHEAQYGVSGLQQAFDEFLLAEEETKLLYHVDGIGRPLFGVNVKYIADSNPFYPISVKTTIDREFQQVAENLFESYNVNQGGLILLDIETNEVLALVSKPDLDRNDSTSYSNFMFEPIFPGSVFKTVIAAAALEEGLVKKDERFNCDLDMYGEVEQKEKKQLGMLSFEESFARSCNYTFAKIGQDLIENDLDTFEKYAEKLGLLHLVGWNGAVYHYEQFKQIPEEKKGVVWKEEDLKKVPKAVAQTAIGQLDVQLSPLSIVNMMATIARGGEQKSVKLVSDLLYKNGTTMFHFEDQTVAKEVLSSYTIQQLQHLLKEVVSDENGTGRRFQSLPIQVAGKSGTAEVDKELVHKWFAGYFPFDKPKYALVVVEMNTKSSAASTNAIFYDMVKTMYKE